jgi:hemerythrin
MEYFQWQKTYSVGIDEIDEQHKKIITMLKSFKDSVLSGKSLGEKEIPALLEEAFDYLDIHFRTEEKYMNIFKYPGYKEHKKEHNDFVKEIIKFQRDFKKGKKGLDLQMLDFFQEWFIKHILGTDKKMGEFLETRK